MEKPIGISTAHHPTQSIAAEPTRSRRSLMHLLFGLNAKDRNHTKLPYLGASTEQTKAESLAPHSYYPLDTKPEVQAANQLYVPVYTNVSAQDPLKKHIIYRRPKTSDGVIRGRWHKRFRSSKDETQLQAAEATTPSSCASTEYDSPAASPPISRRGNVSSSSSYSDPSAISDQESSISSNLSSVTPHNFGQATPPPPFTPLPCQTEDSSVVSKETIIIARPNTPPHHPNHLQSTPDEPPHESLTHTSQVRLRTESLPAIYSKSNSPTDSNSVALSNTTPKPSAAPYIGSRRFVDASSPEQEHLQQGPHYPESSHATPSISKPATPTVPSTLPSHPKSDSNEIVEHVAIHQDEQERKAAMNKQRSFHASGRRHTVVPQGPMLQNQPSRTSLQSRNSLSSSRRISFAPSVRQVNRPAPKGPGRFTPPSESHLVGSNNERPNARLNTTSGRGGAGRRPSTAPEAGTSIFIEPELVFYPRTLILVRKNVDLSESGKSSSSSSTATATATANSMPAEDKADGGRKKRRSWWRRDISHTDQEVSAHNSPEPVLQNQSLIESTEVETVTTTTRPTPPPSEDGHVVLWHGQTPQRRSFRQILSPTIPKNNTSSSPAISCIVTREDDPASRTRPILSQLTLPSYYPVKTQLDLDWDQQTRME